MGMIPLSPQCDSSVNELRDSRKAANDRDEHTDGRQLEMTYLTLLGNGMGSLWSFSDNWSMRSTFHLSLWTCQVPNANVKTGMRPKATNVGFRAEERFAV